MLWWFLKLLKLLSVIPGLTQVVQVVKNPPANAGDVREGSSIPGWGRSPRGGHGNPLQYSFLEKPLDRGAWRARVRRVSKSRTRLKRLSTHSSLHFNESDRIRRRKHQTACIKPLTEDNWAWVVLTWSLWASRDSPTEMNLEYPSCKITKIMVSGPITSWQIDRETVGTLTDFIF